MILVFSQGFFSNGFHVLSFSLPLDKQMSTLANVTHIICQNTNTKFTAEEIKALGQTNINLVNMNYLQACIVNEQFPDAANFRYSPTKS